jgi:hypothetical protein
MRLFDRRQSRQAPRTEAEWNKVDVVHHLAGAFGYRRYVEIATPTTGRRFDEIDRRRLPVRHLMLYRCTGMTCERLFARFATTESVSARLFEKMERTGKTYDVALVDPYHTYACSRDDIGRTLSAVRDGGAVVVHDCLPPRRELTAPEFMVGDWCGVTYKAFIDVVLDRGDLDYATVDTDYGCGVLFKGALSASQRRRLDEAVCARAARDGAPEVTDPTDELRRDWSAAGDNFERAFTLLETHSHALLRLVSVDGFRQALGDLATTAADA